MLYATGAKLSSYIMHTTIFEIAAKDIAHKHLRMQARSKQERNSVELYRAADNNSSVRSQVCNLTFFSERVLLFHLYES